MTLENQDGNRIPADVFATCAGYQDAFPEVCPPNCSATRNGRCDSCTGGINSNCFDPGEIQLGITIRQTVDRPLNTNPLLHVQPGWLARVGPTENLIANFFADGMVYYFDDPRGIGNSATVSAFGAELRDMFTSSDLEVSALLDSGEEFKLTAGPGSYLGLCCLDNILQVKVQGIGNALEYADEIQFGDRGACVIPPPPLDLDGLHAGMETLEFKLDVLKDESFKHDGGGRSRGSSR
jgi:hypothetical protein